ncbi:flagellar protein FlgN [Proteinivorax hydrogeniformans]|uniref:Flagellar protein FlgN n=1 Tax=Proteinivorax hydrogeniformans TaxID=1826727 RepID=A0AAU8HUV8_9FIRM
MVQKYLDKMLDKLDEQVTLYCKLMEVTEKKRDTLVQNAMEQLEEVVDIEAKLVKQIADVEKERYNLQKQLANQMNISVDNVNTDMLIPLLTPEQKQRMDTATEDLKEYLSKLSMLNQTNKKLLDQSLKMVQYSLNYVAGERDSEKTYSKTPNKKRSGGKFMDIQA